MKFITDVRGRWVGSATASPNRTTYLDAKGRVAGRVMDDKTFDAKGRVIGRGDQGMRLFDKK